MREEKQPMDNGLFICVLKCLLKRWGKAILQASMSDAGITIWGTLIFSVFGYGVTYLVPADAFIGEFAHWKRWVTGLATGLVAFPLFVLFFVLISVIKDQVIISWRLAVLDAKKELRCTGDKLEND